MKCLQINGLRHSSWVYSGSNIAVTVLPQCAKHGVTVQVTLLLLELTHIKMALIVWIWN